MPAITIVNDHCRRPGKWIRHVGLHNEKGNVDDDGSQFDVQGLDAAMINTMVFGMSVTALNEDCGRHDLVRAWKFRQRSPHSNDLAGNTLIAGASRTKSKHLLGDNDAVESGVRVPRCRKIRC